jgi:hypothetical protein
MIELILFLGIVWVLFIRKPNAEGMTAAGWLSHEKPRIPANFGMMLLTVVLAFNIFLLPHVGNEMSFFSYTPARELFFLSLGLGLSGIIFAIELALLLKRKAWGWFTFSLLGVVAGSGAMLVLRSNGFVQGVNVWMIALSLFLLFLMGMQENPTWSGFWLVRQKILFFPRLVKQMLVLAIVGMKPKKSVIAPASSGKDAAKNVAASKADINKETPVSSSYSLFRWLKAGVIALIVTLFFAGLLSSADPVFRQLFDEFFSSIFVRLLISLLVAFGVAALVTQHRSETEQASWQFKWFGIHDLNVTLGAVVVLFACFLIVQVRYLFGSADLLTAFDLTMSEYVRKGFTELLITTFFAGLLSYFSSIRVRAQEKLGEKGTMLRAFLLVLLGELLLLVGSALKRNSMYIDMYGLTRIRIVGLVLVGWLVGMILLMILFTAVSKLTEKRLLAGIWSISLVAWIVFNSMNMDMIVARGTPKHENYKDYLYVSNLSDDARSVWKDMILSVESDINTLIEKPSLTSSEEDRLAGAKLAIVSLKERRNRLYMEYADGATLMSKQILTSEDFQSDMSREDMTLAESISKYVSQRPWQSWNYSEYQAFLQMRADETLYFDRVNGLSEKLRSFQVKTNKDLYESEDRLLNELEHPFVEYRMNYSPRRGSY